MAKGRAVGYSDFYKGNEQKPPGSRLNKPETPMDQTEEELKKEALKRRLRGNKTSKRVTRTPKASV
jgi:hypothetical protein